MRLRLLYLGALLMFAPLPASAAFDAGFAGYWGGSGTITLTGASEKIKCRSTIALSDSNANLHMNLRCASPSYTVDVGIELANAGTRVTGSWIIKTHDITGTVVGVLAQDAITAQVVSNGFTAKVAVVKASDNMTVRINPSGDSSIKAMTIALHRGK